MKKWSRILASLLSVLMLVSTFTFEGGEFFKASALRREIVRDYTVGKTIDYDSVFSSAYIIVPNLNKSTAVTFTYRGRAVSEKYNASRHFATVAEAVSYYNTNDGTASPVFYLCAGTYSSSRLSFPKDSIILGANAGVSPNAALNFDLPDVTKGWDASTRYDETVLTLGIGASGNIVVDGIKYNGTDTFYVATDDNTKSKDDITVILQNSILSGFASSSRYFDTSAAINDMFGYDIKECRITDSESFAPFYSNTRFIHTDGLYFTNITGCIVNFNSGITSYEFSLDFYRTYVYKCASSRSTYKYGFYVKYSSDKHKTSLVFDKFLWYEGNSGEFGFITFFTTPDAPGTSHTVDIINSTFLADKSYANVERKTLINGNQSDYQLGTYTINFNNNRVIGFGSMFPNVGGQGGTQRIHADFNNNYFASSFTSVSDTSTLRSDYSFSSYEHGTNDYNNIDYARADDLNYYTNYALTTSTRDFYAKGVSFFDNVDYVSIDNANMKIYVGMRSGTVSSPKIIFENSGVSAELYKTHTSIFSYQSFSGKITSFSAPSRGSSVTYHFKAVKGSVTKCFELIVYGEDSIPYFNTSYTDPTGTLSSSAYLLYSGSATSGDVSVDVDGTTYLFTLGKNAFKTVNEIFTAAGSNVPEIFVPYGSYGNLTITKPCKIVGQNRRGNVYASLDGTVVRGADWITEKTANFNTVSVSCDGVSFAGITFNGKVTYTSTAALSIKNCEFAGSSYLQLTSGTPSVELYGLGISSTAASFITGALPAIVDVKGCYFEKGTAITNLTWDVNQSAGSCVYNVDFCRFDNVKSCVISDVRRGAAADTANITMNVTNNTFNVTDSSKYAVNVKPVNYNQLVFTENTFVSTTDSGSPLYLDTSTSIATLDFERNRFVGFANITISDTSVFDSSYNYFAPYSIDYEVADNGIAIPGDIMCSYYYSDYTLTNLKPSVEGYKFSDKFTVSGNLLTYVTDKDVTDITKDITAECAYTLWDEKSVTADATALATVYDTTVFTIRFYNQYAPCNRIDYKLKVVREGAEELSFITDSGAVTRSENGEYVLTLPEYATGTSFAVVGHSDAQLSTGGTVVDGITDLREGESRDYIVKVNGISYRLHVTIPLSSGVYIDYDAVVDTAYIIGANKSGNNVSFYYRGKTVTQAYNSARHFDTFDEAYSAFLATKPDIILATPVFIFAPGNYSAISLKYRAIILGANAGISPIANAATNSKPYTVPALNSKRSSQYATKFYGSITRAADDGTITNAETVSDNRLTYYTVIDGIDVHTTRAFFNENSFRPHYTSIQNVTTDAPLTVGGGAGELTVKNAYVNGVRTVSEMTTDKLTIDGSYITGALSLFSGSNNVIVKKNFILSCATAVEFTGNGKFALENNVISNVENISVLNASESSVTGNIISGGMPITVNANTFVDGNRFIGYDTINAANLGKNYIALNFNNEDDVLGLALGEDYYYDYKMTASRSDFELAGVSFDDGVHKSTIDNDGAVVKLTFTDKNAHAVTFIPATNGVVAQLDTDKVTSDNSYMLTLTKSGYSRQFTVITVYDNVTYFTDSKGYGDVKNTAVMIDPDALLFNGEGGIIEWRGKTYKYVYGQNLFTSAEEARKALTGHLQLMLPARDFEGEFVIPSDSSVYGVNFDVNPNIQTGSLGDDWARNDNWGVYGETAIMNVTVPRDATGTLVELYGITLRGRIWDGNRVSSSLCTEFNMVNIMVEHLDWNNTIYGGSSANYTITLTNTNSTTGRNNIDRGMIKNMRVEKLRVNSDIAGNKNRFLNERLPQTFTIDGLYMDMTKADCSLFGWMKMSDYQKDGSVTFKNCNLRNAINIKTTTILAFEGRDHKEVRLDESVKMTVENCTFYNMQPGTREPMLIAVQSYSDIDINNNLFLTTATPSKQPITFGAISTLTYTNFNLKENRFVGTKNVISFGNTTGVLDLSDNYYAAYSSNYKSGTTTSSLSGTNAACNSYYTDFDCHFKNTDIAKYSFGNTMVADYKNKTLSLTLPSSSSTSFKINDYVEKDGGHTFVSTVTTLNKGAETVGTVTVGGTDVYTLTVYLNSVKDELVEIYDAAVAYADSDDITVYTDASRAALERALDVASRAINGTDESKHADAKNKITAAMAGLVVDRSEIDSLIASVPDNADGRYSADSYQRLITAVNEANSIGNNVTLKALDQIKRNLKDALSGLVDVRDFNNALEAAKAVADNGVYSSAAVAQFKNRIADIENNTTLNTDIDVQRAVLLINNAYTYLTKDAVALNSAIARAESLAESDCTVVSYNNVRSALEAAYTINADSYQAEIDNAAKQLKLALDRVVNAREFNEALSRAIALTNDGEYSDESWGTYTVGLENIRARSLSFATYSDVLKGISDIALLSAGLLTDTVNYETVVNKYNAVKESKSDYTADSFSVVEKAYADLISLDVSEATEQSIENAVKALNGAIEALVKKADATAKITALKAATFDDSYCENTVKDYFNYVNALSADTAKTADDLAEWEKKANAIVKQHVYEYVNDNNATCTAPATETGTCQCGKQDVRKVEGSELGHKYGEYIYNNDATFEADGTKTATCERCANKDTVVAEGTKLTLQLQDTSLKFEDVNAKGWYKKAIDYAYSHGLVYGLTETEYGVNTEITRGMFITILARIANVDTSKTANKNANTVFKDVEAGRFYSAAIAWAYEKGIVAGVDKDHFAPNDAIQRQQLCVMVMNLVEKYEITVTPSEDKITFKDADTISDYAKEAVELCQTADIVNGYKVDGGFEFHAKDTATRAEAAQILYKFHKDFYVPSK